MLEINISEQTKQTLKELALQNNQSVADFAGKIVEKEIANGKPQEAGKTDLENTNQTSEPERKYLRMKGMFSGGKTDTARRAKDILRNEIGHNGFGDFDN